MASASTPSQASRGIKSKRKEPEPRLKQAQRAANLLKHISDPTRLQILLMLGAGEKHVGALCGQLSQSQPSISHHLALLRHGGVISPRRQGKNNFYSLTEIGEVLVKSVQGHMA